MQGISYSPYEIGRRLVLIRGVVHFFDVFCNTNINIYNFYILIIDNWCVKCIYYVDIIMCII